MTSLNFADTVFTFLALLGPQKVLLSFARLAAVLDTRSLREYVGSYTAVGLGTFTVNLRGDALYVQLSGQPALPVYASAKDQFFYKVVEAQIRFNRDAAGRVTSLTLHQNGLEVRANRGVP